MRELNIDLFGRVGQMHDTGAELIPELYFNTPWNDKK